MLPPRTAGLAILLVVVVVTLHITQAQVANDLNLVPGQYVVKLRPETVSRAHQIASTLGLQNHGSIGSLENMFVYKRPNAMPSAEDLEVDKRTTEEIESHDAVLWAEQDRYTTHTLDTLPADPDYVNGNDWHLRNSAYPGVDINVTGVWESGNTGQGVVVSLMDNGIFSSNTDIEPNFLLQYSWNFETRLSDPTPSSLTTTHGTFCAGLIAGSANSFCGVGVAHGAKIAGVRFIGTTATNSDIANYLTKYPTEVSISSNSWGYTPCRSSCTLVSESKAIMAAMEYGALHGREGKGRIYVFSGGNNGQDNGDVNYVETKTARFSMAISALDKDGTRAYYSSEGAAIFMCAPGGGILDDVHSLSAYSCGSGSGSSFACPQVSGTVALMLSQNPGLSWRDVKHILAKTAVNNHPSDSDWQVNGGGYHFNHKYGFGLVDAYSAVEMTKTWVSVPEEALLYHVVSPNTTIPDNNPEGITSSVTITENITVEHVNVVLNIQHPRRGQLSISLVSPSGVVSKLMLARLDTGSDFTDWNTLTYAHWGESSVGTWQLLIKDTEAQFDGVLQAWELKVYGYYESAVTPTETPLPTPTPSAAPSAVPSTAPSAAPSEIPTETPTAVPSHPASCQSKTKCTTCINAGCGWCSDTEICTDGQDGSCPVSSLWQNTSLCVGASSDPDTKTKSYSGTAIVVSALLVLFVASVAAVLVVMAHRRRNSYVVQRVSDIDAHPIELRLPQAVYANNHSSETTQQNSDEAASNFNPVIYSNMQ